MRRIMVGVKRVVDYNVVRAPRRADATAAQTDGGTPRFVIGWRSAAESGESLRVGTFVVNPATARSSRALIAERSHFGVAGFHTALDAAGLMTTWRATSGQISEIRALGSDIRGDVGTAIPRTVSSEEVVAGSPVDGAFGSMTFVVYTRTKYGARNLIATVYDDQWVEQGEVVLVDDRPASAFDVRDLAIVPAANGIAVAWGETGTGGDEVYAAFLGADVVDAAGCSQAVTIMCLVSFRSVIGTIMVVMPLALVSILVHAVMAIVGIGLKVNTLPMVALGAGIGVDYGIYLFSRMQEQLRRGHNVHYAYLSALHVNGAAIFFTGVTLAIGVATWVFSPLKFQADVGLMLTFMFLVNMLGAMLLLPALGAWLLPRDSTVK